jgi:predicted methyltransferase
MGNELINSLNVDAVAKVGDMYTKALANGGESGINLLNNIVEKSGDSADEVMTALSEMDITSMSAEEVNEALKRLNIDFELTENQVYVLGKILSDTSKVTVEEAQKTYKEISSILFNLKQEGDTIEQEAYDKLLKLNPALSSYFTMMADGTYMLTGAAEDFRRAV